LREKIYFLTHGVPHFYPNDSLRLVMVPGVSVPLAIAFYFAFVTIFGTVLGVTFFAGFVTGYLIYDTTHYVVHHKACRGRISAFLKKLHMRHHYVDPDRDYGVSSPTWDFVWRTWGGNKKAVDSR
jgi:sterol desaturase/sphingolipid hydroxylase (fatty acid hydroxylase superfamily)